VVVLATAVITFRAAPPAHAQQSCPAADDLAARAQEKLSAPAPTRTALEDADQLLGSATTLCPARGDFYWYRSLVADQLGKKLQAEYYRQQAEDNHSSAMKSGKALGGAVPLATGAAPAPMKISPYVRKRLALVIGVGQFKDSAINPLRYTASDAKSFGEFLSRDAGFDSVKILIDADATTRNIRAEIDQLGKTADPEDLVVLYVSSHGSPEGMDTAGISYIVTYDTEVNNLYASAFPMEELIDNLGARIKAERVVAFMDTCYSGQTTFKKLPEGWNSAGSRSLVSQGAPSTSTLEPKLRSASTASVTPGSVSERKGLPQSAGRVVITSSAANERSWEDERIQHGYFTYYLLEALRQPATPSIEDVYKFISVQVSQAVKRDKQESQTPKIARSQSPVQIYLRDPH